MTDPIIPSHTKMLSARQLFKIEANFEVPVFVERSEHVPDIDPSYCFNQEVTLAILAGFMRNRRVMLQGMHGTGKSTHIEQVAARLNWPCVRVNLDGHISRLDLIGKDGVVLQDGLQVTSFQEGIVPWALQQPMALIFDEYDAGRPDVMFVIQRLLEKDGKLTLTDQNRVITPHRDFRLFATANTIGLGNSTGLYHGTQILNHAQMDRWNIVANLDFLEEAEEEKIVISRLPELDTTEGHTLVCQMIRLASLTRKGFEVGDLSVLMSPRTVITWAENYLIFKDMELSFKLSFLNKCEEHEQVLVNEYYQRCFAKDVLTST